MALFVDYVVAEWRTYWCTIDPGICHSTRHYYRCSRPIL